MPRKNITLLLFVLITLAFVVSACGSSSTNEPTNESQSVEQGQEEEAALPSEEVEEEELTTIRFPLTSDPSTLEAGIAKELYATQVALNLHIGLFDYDANTELVPYAVKEYEVSEDNTVYTFHLHENIVWHNGRPLVAEDFKKGWERHLDPNVGAQDAGEGLYAILGAEEVFTGEAEEISGVKVIDDYTLEVTLTQPSLSFLYKLAMQSASWIVPEEAVKSGEAGWVDQPVGAGPYKFVEWTPGVKIVLESNPDFFLGEPEIDIIEFLIVPDNNTSLAMFESGELDFAPVPSAELDRLGTSDELHFWTKGQLQYLGMNQSVFEPFKDVRIRQAFNYAIDRKIIIESVLKNVLEPATGLVPPNIPEYNADLEGYAYDPAKAQELLAEAGYPNGEGFPVLDLATLSTTVGEAIAAQLSANLNITVEVLQPERGDMISGLWSHDKWDFYYFGWTAEMPSASIWTYELLYSGLDSNFATYSNAEVDAQIDQAMSATDFETAKQHWQEAERLAVEDAAMIPFGYTQSIYMVNSEISDFNCNLFGPMGFYSLTKNP